MNFAGTSIEVSSPDGVETGGPARRHDLERTRRTSAPRAVVRELGGEDAGAALAVDVELDPGTAWLVRCDRIDFPPGGVAYRHVHPAPASGAVAGADVFGAAGESHSHGPGGAWFEGAGFPVLATASAGRGDRVRARPPAPPASGRAIRRRTADDEWPTGALLEARL